jgi:hypothetical protein
MTIRFKINDRKVPLSRAAKEAWVWPSNPPR